MGRSHLIMKGIFQYTGNLVYELMSANYLWRANKYFRFGSESIANLRTKILNLIPEEIKASNTLNTFKSRIKRWCPQNCPFRLNHVGFID